ncbi:hypothetical protein PMPD1_1863 [Paramixta manurensis]|uniref:Uncharacterized protein n=1 Tax=Paramixta manurensis TaxID=2740817 RepID=A0A6M8UND6_9GAMM|nr:hypothetical protein PMPD1_1863 [Erwiniaceae bacterium PD-1]
MSGLKVDIIHSKNVDVNGVLPEDDCATAAGAAQVHAQSATGAASSTKAASVAASHAAPVVGQTKQNILSRVEHGAPFPLYEETQGITGNILDGTHSVSDEKTMLPLGRFTSTRWARNRGGKSSFTGFMLKGQGSHGTIIKHPASTGVGDHIFADNIYNSYIGGFTLDNSDLTPGTDQGNSRNGQVWITKSEDTQFDDIAFAGGDVLSFVLGECKNILSTNLKVDFQYRYPTGYSKSPLIVGDFSEKCIFMGGYVRSMSRDGKNIYTGDLADNDQANDSKWAFINLIGLHCSVKLSMSAAMWQEGEHAPNNAHFIGMNYYGHGIGHGISERAIGTDIGCSTRDTQGRGVWNLNCYYGIGGHFFDIKGENTNFASQTRGAIYSDNARMTVSVGQHFLGNTRDFADYSSGTSERAGGMFSVADNLSSLFYVGSAKPSRHHGITSSRMEREATIVNSGRGNHFVLMNTLNIGPIGKLSSAPGSVTDIIGCTLFTDQADSLLVQSGTAYSNFKSCVIRGYASIGESYTNAGYTTFESCTFFDTTFTDDDLQKSRYINCVFTNCVNAPDVCGLNFKADSAVRPSSARFEIKVTDGQVVKIPTWLVEARGIYDIKVGGRREDNDYLKATISKKRSRTNAVVSAVAESTPGAITVAWPPDAAIELHFSKGGNYNIKIG